MAGPKISYSDRSFAFFLALVCMGVGILAGQYYLAHHPQSSKHLVSTVEIRRTHDLSRRLHQLEYQNAHLTSEIAESTLGEENRFGPGRVSRYKALGDMLGLSGHKGQGVEVVIRDSTRPAMLGENPNTGIVHNTDLAQVVNELRAGGAKGVSINGQPITGMTGINCSGPIITINGVRMASPFIVQAIGDTKRMNDYVSRRGSFLKTLEKYDIDVRVSSKKVAIPPASDLALGT